MAFEIQSVNQTTPANDRKSARRAIVRYAAGRSFTQPLIFSNIIHPSNVLASDTISFFHGGSFMSGNTAILIYYQRLTVSNSRCVFEGSGENITHESNQTTHCIEKPSVCSTHLEGEGEERIC